MSSDDIHSTLSTLKMAPKDVPQMRDQMDNIVFGREMQVDETNRLSRTRRRAPVHHLLLPPSLPRPPLPDPPPPWSPPSGFRTPRRTCAPRRCSSRCSAAPAGRRRRRLAPRASTRGS
eukprot:5659942-Prymnesium_polylepis.1